MIRTQEIFVIQLDRYNIHDELFTKKEDAEKVAGVMRKEYGDEMRAGLQKVVDESSSTDNISYAEFMLNDDHAFSHVYKIGICSYKFEVLTLKNWLGWLSMLTNELK